MKHLCWKIYERYMHGLSTIYEIMFWGEVNIQFAYRGLVWNLEVSICLTCAVLLKLTVLLGMNINAILMVRMFLPVLYKYNVLVHMAYPVWSWVFYLPVLIKQLDLWLFCTGVSEISSCIRLNVRQPTLRKFQ